MSSNPYSDNNQPSPYEFQSQLPATYPNGDGYIKQIPVLGVLHIVQAVLELPMSLVFMGLCMFMIAAQNSPQMQQQAQGGVSLVIIGIFYGIFGAVIGLVALLRLVSGIQLLRKRGRVLTIVTSLVGLVTLFSCYCAPTTFGLAIYSLVVLVQPSVIQEFNRSQRSAELQ